MRHQWSDDTICGHQGEEREAPFRAIVPPLYLNSLHSFERVEDIIGAPADDDKGLYYYGRVGNPTTHLLEDKLNALERGAGCLCFGSGMAAITSAIMYCVRMGGHIVAVRNSYGPARQFFQELKRIMDVDTTYVTGRDPEDFARASRMNTCLYYLESPSSVVMELQDLRAVATLASQRGIKTIIDNTWCTPLFQKPINMGIDFVVHTMSKYIGGHSDIIGGALIAASKEDYRIIKSRERELFGGILGPFESWLAIRGLRTLPARLRQHSQSARVIAERLEAHPKVEKVFYPGLPSFGQAELASRQMCGFSGLLSFIPKPGFSDTCRGVNAMELFRRGVSWGGFESLVVMPQQNLPPEQAAELGGAVNLVRLAVGLEDVEDLWADIEAALEEM